jgi:hypothetical protein
MSDKERYSAICEKYKLPVFMQDWWMDSVCGPENWAPVFALDGAGEVEAALVCYIYRKFGLRIIIPAPLTPFSGIWFRPVHQRFKKHAENQRIIDLTAKLIAKIPNSIYTLQQFHFSFDNWLSFRWAGYSQSTRYTYFLDKLHDLEQIQDNFKGSTRTAIKKAETFLSVVSSDDAVELFELVNAELTAKRVKFPLKKAAFLSLDEALKARHCSRIFFAIDDNGKKHAALYTVWDDHTTYLLLTAVNRVHQNGSALSFLIWNAIKDAAERGNAFDFEGSSLQHIEPFFRSFGGEPKSYYRITKAKNKIWDFIFYLSGKGKN